MILPTTSAAVPYSRRSAPFIMASLSALSKLTGALSRARSLQHVAATAARVPAVAMNKAAYTQSRNRSHGGLRDEDRIFKNLYGLHDYGLKGDMKRVRALTLLCARPATVAGAAAAVRTLSMQARARPAPLKTVSGRVGVAEHDGRLNVLHAILVGWQTLR